MEKLSYNSYPDSAESSPRSRDVDFDNPPPWEDQQQQTQSYKVKFMCSYGGKIQPRPHDNQLTYVNGDTKIMSVDRSIRFQSLVSKLSVVCGGGDGGGGGEISFKYQLPGEDLDALISVTNEDDLEHMMHEYDRLYRMSTKPARLRLFIFSSSPISGGFRSEGSIKSERETLNPIPSRPESEKSVTAPSSNADFLFGSEKLAPQAPSVPQQIHEPVTFEQPVYGNQPAIQPDPAEIQRQIHEFQMIQIRDQEQQQQQQIQQMIQIRDQEQQQQMQQMIQIRDQEQQQQMQQQQQQMQNQLQQQQETGRYFSPAPATVSQANQQPPVGYWQGNNNIPGNVYSTMSPNLPEQQQVYMIQPQPQSQSQAPGTLYHSVMRPPTQGNQGYYPPVQAYMEQQNQQGYNVVQPQYSGGPQVMTSAGPRGLQETAPFQQMGNQVYYTVAGDGKGMMVQPQQSQPQYQGMGQPVSGMTDSRTGPDGKGPVNMAPKVSDSV